MPCRTLAICLQLWGTKLGTLPRTPVSPKSTSYSELSFTLRFAMIAAYLVSLDARADAGARIPCQNDAGLRLPSQSRGAPALPARTPQRVIPANCTATESMRKAGEALTEC